MSDCYEIIVKTWKERTTDFYRYVLFCPYNNDISSFSMDYSNCK